MKIAVIGTGISGNLTARLLASDHEVHIFEANDYLGGHTHTVDVEVAGRRVSADTGFMVFNDRTYPNFVRMLSLLGVAAQPSDMSFSVACRRTGLEYQGSSLNGLFAQRINLVRPRFFGMLRDIVRFNRAATRAVLSGELDDGTPVGDFLRDCGVGSAFRTHYLVPMVSAIWSAEPASILEFPARFLVGFLHNHGLLQVRDRPRWKTIPGGARQYVRALLGPLRDQIRLACPIQSVQRSADHVELRLTTGNVERFDQVVIATHSDQALAMLTDPSPAERQVLGAFSYQPNEAVLHTDTSLLPRRRRAWASWNYHLAAESEGVATLTYDLTRLQRLDTPAPLLLSLNCVDLVAPEKVLQRMTYHHPAYSRDSVQAQRRHDEINGVRRTHFCGAYWGYGFHEDGVNSALAVAKYFGKSLDSCTAASTKAVSPTAGTRP